MKHFAWILILLIFSSTMSACLPANQNTPVEAQPVNQPKCPDTSNPWDIFWLPSDKQGTVNQLNSILNGTGLSGQGNTIINLSVEYQINPAFALAMFKKEASFAIEGSRAYRNNNPGNIRPTGDCKGKAGGSACNGLYGEISTDGSFGIYPDMVAGIKAYYMLLNSNYRPDTKRNCQDIACIISAYAPSSENDTNSYIKQVTDWTTQYQCEILSSNNVIISAPQIPTQSSIGATITSETTTPEVVQESQYNCFNKSLSPEELVNCGNHEYLYTQDILETEGPTICDFSLGDDVKHSEGMVLNSIGFLDDRVKMSSTIFTKVTTNIYQYQRNERIGVITFNENGFEYDGPVFEIHSGEFRCDIHSEYILK